MKAFYQFGFILNGIVTMLAINESKYGTAAFAALVAFACLMWADRAR